MLLGAGLCISFLYIDRVAEISVSARGLAIKVREASDALAALKRLAALMGRVVINLDANAGAIGGNSAEHRDQLKQQVLDYCDPCSLIRQH